MTHSLLCLWLVAFATISTAVDTADSIPSPTSPSLSTPSPEPASTPSPSPVPEGECKLLGPFSLLVQVALGAIALLSLVYKRWKERPQRPLKVWAFDVSKQVFGSSMLHLANIFMSMFSAGQFDIAKKYNANPCSYYLLNLGIDTTFGIPILMLILRILNYFASYTPLADPPESIESGNYGNPPRATWWFKQSIIYFVGLLGMKICVVFIIQLVPFIVQVGDWALRWTEGNMAVQIIFVMLLFPVTMNAIQYYIIDALIKKPNPVQYDSLAERDDEIADALMDDDRHRRSALLAAMDSDTSDSDVDLAGKTGETDSRRSSFSRDSSGEFYRAVNTAHEGSLSAASEGSSKINSEYRRSSIKLAAQRGY